MLKQVKKAIHILKLNWQIVGILSLALFLRVFRLESLTTFSGDQGIDLLVVKRMIVDHRWTLLGPKTSLAPIYNGPIYYYLLLPVLYFSKLNPISASYFMVFLWIGAIYLTFLIGKKYVNYRTGVLAALFFAIWPLGIEYSRQSFNSFPTPFFSAVFLLELLVFIKKKNRLAIFLAGLSFGVMMQLHYFNIFLLSIFIYFHIKEKLGFRPCIAFILGFLITFSPMLFFELRHNFFNVRTLTVFLKQNTISNFSFKIHYFIAFFPLLFLLTGRLLDLLFKKNKYLGIILMLILLFLNLKKIDLFRENGFTMPEGWNYPGVRSAGKIIADDAAGSFNVASILDGDTRAYPLRYIIEVNGKKPMGVEDYPKAEVLYVIAKGDSDFVLKYPVWEIESFLPAKVAKEWPVQNNYKVFKLMKIN